MARAKLSHAGSLHRDGPPVGRARGRIAELRSRGPGTRSPNSSSCTASACRPAVSAGRGSSGCSRTRCLPDADPYFATIQHLRVSSHVLIARDGALTQYVPFDLRAWHAGTSHWRGRERLQRFLDRHRARGHGRRALRRSPVRGARRARRSAAASLSLAGGGLDRRPQRHRARAQDRPGSGIRLAPARAAPCARRGAAFRREVLA